MKSVFRCAALVLAAAWASTGAVEGVERLQVQGRTEIAEAQSVAPGGHLVYEGRPVCDADSNVFLRLHGNKETPSRLVRISADGKKTVAFDVTTVPGHQQDVVSAIAVGLDGHNYILAKGSKGTQAILDFDRDGKFKSAVTINPRRLSIKSFGVFDSSNLLISGYAFDEADKTARPEPISGIFNSSGELVAPLVDREDANEGAQKKAAPLVFSDLGSIEPGESGTLYLVRPALAGPVLAVSASGVIQSSTELEPPKGAQVRLGVKIFKDRLAVNYLAESDEDDGPARAWIQVYDLVSGKKISEYTPPPKITQLTCYSSSPVSGDVFTMLGWSEGNLQFVHLSH